MTFPSYCNTSTVVTSRCNIRVLVLKRVLKSRVYGLRVIPHWAFPSYEIGSRRRVLARSVRCVRCVRCVLTKTLDALDGLKSGFWTQVFAADRYEYDHEYEYSYPPS
eukprot:scaffold567530_cov22-Prasinocladus_malaysianus.AAC.1